MARLDRDEPFPEAMQGRWALVDEPSSELVIEGAEVTCLGQPVGYDFKDVERKDGALTVSLRVSDEAREDEFQRTNITQLVLTPAGEFHAYNIKFAERLVRKTDS